LLYLFDDFALDTDRRELRRGDTPVGMQPQVFDLLEYLIRNRERVVTKDDLIAAIWGGRIVSESALTTRLNAARTAVGDSGEAQRLIRTLPRKGVRFVGIACEKPQTSATSARIDIVASKPELVLPDRPSIAVLPFVNMSDDPQQEYLADAITDEIITALSYWRSLFVIARNSTFIYKGRPIDVKQVGSELGVRYILEGSVQRLANRIRIMAQLVDSSTRMHLWANRYERSVDDLFAVQDEITSAISAAVEPEIGFSERDRSRRKLPEHLGAWELYQQGMWHLLRHNRQDSIEAENCFCKAIAYDANFAPPHAARAIIFFFEIARSWAADHNNIMNEMAKEASAAIEIDPKDALGHTALGLHFMERGEFAQSIAEHKLALALNANSPFAHWSYGYVLQRADRLEQALEEFDVALRLNPRDPGNWSHLTLKAGTLYLLGRYGEAATCARDAARMPTVDILWPHVHLAASLAQLGQVEAASAAVAELRRQRPGLTVSAFQSWPHNRRRPQSALARIVDGLRKAGLPE
jgi:TolB-like protein